jgi:hypothetical protein
MMGKHTITAMVVAVLAAVPVLASTATLLPGVYTNEEQVQFAAEAGTPVPPWTGLRIETADYGAQVQRVDAFGAPIGTPERWQVTESADRVSIRVGRCTRDFAIVSAGLTIINQSRACAATGGLTTVTAKGMAMVTADGALLELQRGRAFACEAALPRRDGKAEWWVKTGLTLHDAGGRVAVVTDEVVPQRFTLHLRNIAWPINPADARLLLALHTDDPDAPPSDVPTAAALADPATTRIGVTFGAIEARCALVPPG